MCFVRFGQVLCGADHVSATIAPNHPDDRACQEVTQSDTELLCFAGVSERLCAVNLDSGIDWPVNPQIKLTAAMWQATADNTPKELATMLPLAQG